MQVWWYGGLLANSYNRPGVGDVGKEVNGAHAWKSLCVSLLDGVIKANQSDAVVFSEPSREDRHILGDVRLHS